MTPPRLLLSALVLACIGAPAVSLVRGEAPAEDPPVPEQDFQRDVDLETVRLRLGGERATPARLSVYTTMATWCASCKKEQPQVAYLRSRFAPNEVALFGVPTDPQDDDAKLDAYVEKNAPAYTLLRGLARDDVLLVRRVIYKKLRVDGLPATVVVDGDGRVLLVTSGVPSLSAMKKLLHQVSKER